MGFNFEQRTSLVPGAKLKTFIVIEIGQNVLNCYAEVADGVTTPLN